MHSLRYNTAQLLGFSRFEFLRFLAEQLTGNSQVPPCIILAAKLSVGIPNLQVSGVTTLTPSLPHPVTEVAWMD